MPEREEFVGTIPLRNDITVLPADDPRRLRLEWTISESIGVVIINDYAVARLEIVDTNEVWNEAENSLYDYLYFYSYYKWETLVEGTRGNFDNTIGQLEV